MSGVPNDPNTVEPVPPKPSELPPEKKLDIYKVRIEEYDRNAYSLRDLEWRMAAQVLTGYVAIGAAHYGLSEHGNIRPLLAWWCTGLGVALFLAYALFAYCIQLRMWANRDDRKLYLQKLHDLSPDTRAEEKVHGLFGAYWYGIATQLFIHFLALVTLILSIHFVQKPPAKGQPEEKPAVTRAAV